MSTASIPYILFVLALAVVHAAAAPRLRKYLLLAASLAFYGSFNWAFTVYLVGIIAAGYGAALAIDRWPQARWQVALWTLLILSPLLFYKYALVLSEGLRQSVIPVSTLDWGRWGGVLIPVGLSFFTFQCLGYVFDVARKAVRPETDFALFALFVSFFPSVLSGPIERFPHLGRQLDRAPGPEPDDILDAILMLAFGLFLKTCVGDRLAVYVDTVFSEPARNASATALLGLYGFAFQLYGDFFGYSLIALGSARLFGIRLTLNFRQPFFARDIAEFWQRWHISLTRWIGDYVYRPLATWSVAHKSWPRGAQEGLTLIVTWLAMGLWHGAGWNFILFGAVMAALVFVHNTRARRAPKFIRRGRAPFWSTALAMFVTFHVVVALLALIRAASLRDYVDLLGAIAAGKPGLLTSFDVMAYGAFSLGILAGFDAIARFAPDWQGWRGVAPRVMMTGMLLLLVLLIGNEAGRAFIYFRF
ncbi:MAG: MBOAT family O-acyltransferase [Alphaproteobacteria bacterium]